MARLAALVLALLMPALALAAADPAERALGSAKAKVTVVEYASVTCPHCARFNADVFPAFKAKYIDTGKVRYVFREIPTAPTEAAVAGFMLARCAPPERYFDVIDNLFRGQTKLAETRDGRQWLLDAGKAGGLDEAKIQTCLQDKAALEALTGRVRTALEDDKIESTPTFVIGDKMLVGEQTLATISATIDPLLAAR